MNNKNRLICGCDRVYAEDIRIAVRQGAQTYADVQKVMTVGSGCGNCRVLVERVIREELASLQEDVSAKDPQG